MCPDVTEAENARQRPQLKADILRNVREAVIVADLAGRITLWNDGATEIFGYSSAEMLGKTRERLYPDPAMPLVDLDPIIQGEELLGEWQGRRRDGSLAWVSALRDA